VTIKADWYHFPRNFGTTTNKRGIVSAFGIMIELSENTGKNPILEQVTNMKE